jgi:DNA-binding transcriptional LysR family regulator
MNNLKNINWNQVYYFYEVARNLSMKEAARFLGVSVPTVSEQVSKFEQSIDLKLFLRSPRKLKLTNDGVTLYLHAKEIFESGKKLLDAVSPDSIGGYTVKVGIQESIQLNSAIDFISSYLDTFSPFVTLNTKRIVVAERVMDEILQGNLDWGIAIEKPKSNLLDYRLIDNSEILFYCSNSRIQDFKNYKDLLRRMPFARSSWDLKVNKIIEEHLIKHNAAPDEIIESEQRELCIKLLNTGKCIAALSKHIGESNSLHKSVRSFSMGTHIFVPSYAVWRKGNERMVAIKKLMELLEQQKRI